MEEDINVAPIDYRLVCRTCLTSNAEFYKLTSPITVDDDDETAATFAKKSDGSEISLMEGLQYCTRLNDLPQLPIYICKDCCSSLQLSFNFIRVALEADEILRSKLIPNNPQSQIHQKQESLLKPQLRPVSNKKLNERTLVNTAAGTSVVPMRYRCKVCNEKLKTKKALKEHVTLHMDIISYNCQMCTFECKKRNILHQHYLHIHGVEPAEDQLKPKHPTPQTLSQADKQSQQNETHLSFNIDASNNLMLVDASSDQFTNFQQYPHTISVQNQNVFDQNDFIKLEHELQAEQNRFDQPQYDLQQQQNQQMFQQVGNSNCQQQQDSQELLQQQLPAHLDLALVLDGQMNSNNSASNVSSLINVSGMSNMMNDMQSLPADLQTIDGQFKFPNELSIGNELIVLEDGTVKEVLGNDIVIEFINNGDDGSSLENGIILDNLIKVEQNQNIGVADAKGRININVDDIIMEDQSVTQTTTTLTNFEDVLPHSIIEVPNPKKIKCKICGETFMLQDKLKAHMLSHNEIPHFFCDICQYYTFFKVDLSQHYKDEHDVQPTLKQLQPKNKVVQSDKSKPTFSCEECYFETSLKNHLRRHYASKHNLVATELQLRPTIGEPTAAPLVITRSPAVPLKSVKQDISGINCTKCNQIYYLRNEYEEHLKQHELLEEQNLTQYQNTVETTALPDISSNISISTISNNYNNNINSVSSDSGITNNIDNQFVTTTAPTETEMQVESLLNEVIATTAINDIAHDIVVTTNNADINTNMCNTMTSNFTLPPDAVPQIVETDIINTFDNNVIDFDFNGDGLFEDFDDENDNENDCTGELDNLVLTSDDDLEETLEQNEKGQGTLQCSICVLCNKSFFSQYKFENHMFVHRGLAPYRCEMCTNLYNTKRALIRHYRAVHKRTPTRDMVQAKGDIDVTSTELFNLEEKKFPTLMCAKCPYESADLENLKIHLNIIHGITDDTFILQKLPFECPRCIRSFASKAFLQHHIERSHSTVPIIEEGLAQQNSQSNHQEQQSPLSAIQINERLRDEELNTPTKSLEPHTEAPTASTTTSLSTSSTVSMSSTCSTSPSGAVVGVSGGSTYTTSSIFITNFLTYDDFMNSTTAMESPTIETALTTHATSATSTIETNNSEAVGTLKKNVEPENKTTPFLSPTTSSPEITSTTDDVLPQYKYQCSTCQMKFESFINLTQHCREKHRSRDIYDYKCGICHCKYPTPQLLNIHLKRHLERKHPCKMCPKAFVSITELNNHKLSHTGFKPFVCDVCGKQFRYSNHLNRHYREQHRGRRLMCPKKNCNVTFTRPSALKNHLISRHGGHLPYQCKLCGVGFKQREWLRKHAVKVHNVTLTEEEIANIFRDRNGYTNPHDLTVPFTHGKMLRRADVEGLRNAELQKQEREDV